MQRAIFLITLRHMIQARNPEIVFSRYIDSRSVLLERFVIEETYVQDTKNTASRGELRQTQLRSQIQWMVSAKLRCVGLWQPIT